MLDTGSRAPNGGGPRGWHGQVRLPTWAPGLRAGRVRQALPARPRPRPRPLPPRRRALGPGGACPPSWVGGAPALSRHAEAEPRARAAGGTAGGRTDALGSGEASAWAGGPRVRAPLAPPSPLRSPD